MHFFRPGSSIVKGDLRDFEGESPVAPCILTMPITRFAPLQILYARLGPLMCTVLPALQSLIGCDVKNRHKGSSSEG